jgi:histidyl-tRNA synthetase
VVTPTQVLVTVLDPAQLPEYFRIARMLRSAGISTEVFADDKKLGKQFQYADKKSIPLGIVAGETELAELTVQLKDLRSGEQSPVTEQDLITSVRSILEKE